MLQCQLLLFILLATAILSSCGGLPQPMPPTTTVSPSPSSVSTFTPISTPNPSPTNTPTPSPTTTATSVPTTTVGSAEMTAMSYYQALKDHNYSAAYAFLNDNAIDITTGQKLTLQTFIQLAQDSESAGGPISSFSATAFPPLVVMTVSRSGGPYHAHLTIKQEGTEWKIISLDRI